MILNLTEKQQNFMNSIKKSLKIFEIEIKLSQNFEVERFLKHKSKKKNQTDLEYISKKKN